MPEIPPDGRLVREVTEFADELSELVKGVFPGGMSFAARVTEGATTHVIIEQQPPEGISLTAEGQPLLRLMATFRCAWDHAGEYLAVRGSTIEVSTEGCEEPLFRYDFNANCDGKVPAAHLNVHGHRDELVFALMGAGKRLRGKSRSSAMTRGTIPRLATFHFPLGGHRFRPALEDVVEIMVREFGIDTNVGWEDAVKSGRSAWREKQLCAAVRDDPEVAASALMRLGYAVTWTGDQPRRERRDERVLAL